MIARLFVLTAMMGLTGGALAQDTGVLEGPIGPPAEINPAQLDGSAEPMPLPTVDLEELELNGNGNGDAAPARIEKSESSPGQPPSQAVEEMLSPWFEFEPDAERPLEPEAERSPGPDPDARDEPYDLEPRAIAPGGERYSDTRVFPPQSLLAYPRLTLGKLFVVDPRTRSRLTCSASVINRRIVLTAGHCVYDARNRNFYAGFRFVPIFNNGQTPLGVWSWRRVFVTNQWALGNEQLPNPGDFGVLVMRDRRINGRVRAIGDLTGWLGWRTHSVHNAHIHLFGYPANRDNARRLQLTTAQGHPFPGFNLASLFGSTQTQGASGGPMVTDFGRLAVGVTAGPFFNRVVGVASFGVVNRELIGTSVPQQQFVNLIRAACQADNGNCR